MANFKTGAIISGVLALALVIGVGATTTSVNAGYAGVVYNANGGIEDQTLNQGWHTVAPWKHVIEYPVSTETVYMTKAPVEGSPNDDSFNVSTAEGKPVSVDIMYSYSMKQDKLPHIFTKFKGADAETIQNSFIKSNVKKAIQEVTSMYSVMDLYGEKRGEIQAKIQKNLIEKSELSADGIVIESFSFGEIRPDDNSMKAIQSKVDAQQKLQQMEIEKQQAQVAAEKAVVEAQGRAKAAEVDAEGQAKANKLIRESLSPEVIQVKQIQAQFQAIDKWDGKQPQIVSGNSGLMMQIPQLQAEPAKK